MQVQNLLLTLMWFISNVKGGLLTINWNGNNWALGCDFRGNDLTNKQVSGEQCGGLCAQTQGCTHWAWTTLNKGTCWMKRGGVSKSGALSTGDNSMSCGVVSVNSLAPVNNPSEINWNGNNWALGCDFRGNDLTNTQVSGEQCGGQCAQTPGCTHWAWTTLNKGTCYMKSGDVSQSRVLSTGDNSRSCGVLNPWDMAKIMAPSKG
jgi:hypothetical protein